MAYHTYAFGYATMLIKKLPSLVSRTDIKYYSFKPYKLRLIREMHKLFWIEELRLTKVIFNTLRNNDINEGTCNT